MKVRNERGARDARKHRLQIMQDAKSLLQEWWRHKVCFAISLSITLGASLLYVYTFVGDRPTPIFEFVNRLELNALDTRFRYRPASYSNPDPRIVIVDIDQRAQEVLGRWPFPRVEFAKMLDALHADGASVVGFDVAFSKPDQASAPILELQRHLGEQAGATGADPRLAAELGRLRKEYDNDGELARAIQRFGPVVLGNFFLYSQADLEGISPQTLDDYANLLAYFPFPEVRALDRRNAKQDRAVLIGDFAPYNLVPRGAEANIPVLTDALRGDYAATGFFNVEPDPDGVVRHALTVLPYGRSANLDDWDFYASLDVQVVRLFLHASPEQMVLEYGPVGIAAIDFGPSLRIVPDPIGRLMINYQGPVRTYHYVSLADVVGHTFPPGTFRGKVVLVGASATGIGDLRSTPYGGLDYPGVEIHANVIDNILHKNFLQRGPRQVLWDLILIFLCGLPLGLWLAVVKPRWLLLGLLLIVPLTGGVYYAFLRGWWLNFTIPTLTLVSNVGMVALYRALVEEREKRRVRGAFQQFLSPEVIRRLLQNPHLVEPRKTEITVMFSDIRGFTTISEKLDAQELALLLNQYLTSMTRIVFAHGGTLDKYIGDAVMAFWGAPFEEPGHANNACRAAMHMLDQLADLQAQWKIEGKPHIEIGVGLNTGIASVGNMGSRLRYGYTAMGDTVNLASRLEGLNKEYGTRLLVAESTYRAAGKDSDLLFRELDLIRVKGKLQPVTIYELVGSRKRLLNGSGNGSSADWPARLELFAEGRAFYGQRRWTEAAAIFEQLLVRWPDDAPARMFLTRCKDYLVEGPEVGWDGVYVMTHK
jgi:adenylate cyclase